MADLTETLAKIKFLVENPDHKEESDEEIIIETKKNNVVLDATLMTGLMNCGRFADLRYNHSFVQISGKSNSLECGSLVHKIMEVYYESIINGIKKSDAIINGMTAGDTYIQGCQYCTDFVPSVCQNCGGMGTTTHDILVGGTEHDTEERICQVCNGTGGQNKPKCGHPINEYPGMRNTPPESEGYKVGWKWVLQTCEEYFDYYKNDYWVPIETEVVKRKILYKDNEIRIMWKAKLDLIVDTNQGIYPVDHKTMKQRSDSLNLNNQFTGQCLILDTRGMMINKIGFQKSLKPEEKFQRVLMSYSADRLMEWQSEILPYWAYQLLQYTESGYWPPNYSNCEGKYGNCVFHKVCSGDRNMRETELKREFKVGMKWDIDNLEKE